MALLPFLTAGVAFATAGAVAATVAIAPPMSPGDVQVAKNTEVALNADLRDLINTYFGQFPGDPGNPGTIHAFGVLQQLLQNATVNDPRATDVIDSYFEEGLSDVIRLLLTRDNPSPEAVELIDAYFNNGLADAVRVQLGLFATPEQREWIDTYFGDPDHVNDDGSTNVSQNGASGVVWKALSELGLSPGFREHLDTFFNAQTEFNRHATPGEVPVLRRTASGQIVPALDDEGNPLMSDKQPALDAEGNPTFDAAGNQIFTDIDNPLVGNSNPARRGTWGVIYNVIDDSVSDGPAQDVLDAFWDGGVSEVVKVVLIALSPDPFADKLIADYFDDGIDKVVQTLLTEGTPQDSPYHQLVDEYFNNGVTGVVRYVLTGPVPEEEGPPVPPATTMLRVGSADEAADDEGTTGGVSTLDKKVDAEEKPVITGVPAPAAPVAAPVPAPEPVPEATTQVKEDQPDEEEGANVKTGNKVEPVIILPGGATKSKGGGAWGWDGLADRVNGFVKGAQNATGGAGPAAADPDADPGAGTDGGE
jgi:hypothetical protein